jgi:monoterpene epsilon-lactone hydrolase
LNIIPDGPLGIDETSQVDNPQTRVLLGLIRALSVKQQIGQATDMDDGKAQTAKSIYVPARELSMPAHLSATAQASLSMPGLTNTYPDKNDKKAWRALVAVTDRRLASMVGATAAPATLHTEDRLIAGVRVYVVSPLNLPHEDRGIILEMHGGALVFGGGDTCRTMAQRTATRLHRRVWSVDYRMPPDHPYPAGLDDCIAVYRALLEEGRPSEIIVSGTSAGGNLATALILRAQDEGLPLPAAALLGTPEIDLTESGDSFQTNVGVDSLLRPLMPINLLYADGHDLKHPYLSPLYADFSKGFPPTILTTGTRDLFLSNTVRIHRVLRKVGVQAELHVLEAAGHIGLPGSPEGEELDEEVRQFIKRFWRDGPYIAPNL